MYSTNQYAGKCDCCHGLVKPREGRLLNFGVPGRPRWVTRHHDCHAAKINPAAVVRGYAAVQAPAPVRSHVTCEERFNVWGMRLGVWRKLNASGLLRKSADARARATRDARTHHEVRILLVGESPWALVSR